MCIFLVIAFVYCDIVESESCHIHQVFLEIYLRQLQNHLLPKNQNLKSELTVPYFTFVSFITLVMFQSIEPIIHLLYERIADLSTKLMTDFS